MSDDLRRLAINYFVTHEAREALYADDVFDGLSDEEIGAVNGERVRLTGRMMEIEAALREAGRNLLGDGACQSDAVPNVRGGK